MAYIPSLHKLQLGAEDPFMTPQTVDIQPAGLDIRITPKVETEQLAMKDGSTMPSKYSFTKRRWSEGVIEGYLDYNRAMLWLDGMFAVDADSPHSYIADENAAQTPVGITAIYGQSGLNYQVAGIVPTSLKFSGTSGAPWKFAYNFFGLGATDVTAHEDLTTDVPELVHGYETTLKLIKDLTTAPSLATARTDLGFSFEANITANRAPVWHLGDQEWDTVRQGKWGGSMKLVLEADTTNLGELGDILDATNTGVGFTGRITATDGTNTLTLDFSGVTVTAPVIITDLDGVVTVELELSPQWNASEGFNSCWGAELTIA